MAHSETHFRLWKLSSSYLNTQLRRNVMQAGMHSAADMAMKSSHRPTEGVSRQRNATLRSHPVVLACYLVTDG